MSLTPRWDGANLFQNNSAITGYTNFSLTGIGPVLEAQPLAVKLRLPRWTFLVGAIIDFVLLCRVLISEGLSQKQ
jgi:hypothetical protein